jgi:cytochrome c553
MQKRTFIQAGLAALIVTTTMTGASAVEKPAALKSETVDLPFGDRNFSGPNADAINNNCLACHSAGMVLNQPTMPRAMWQAEVDKMRAVYKAPIAAGDVKPIVDYLAQLKGPH